MMPYSYPFDEEVLTREKNEIAPDVQSETVYDFIGYNIEININVMLTPVAIEKTAQNG